MAKKRIHDHGKITANYNHADVVNFDFEDAQDQKEPNPLSKKLEKPNFFKSKSI